MKTRLGRDHRRNPGKRAFASFFGHNMEFTCSLALGTCFFEPLKEIPTPSLSLPCATSSNLLLLFYHGITLFSAFFTHSRLPTPSSLLFCSPRRLPQSPSSAESVRSLLPLTTREPRWYVFYSLKPLIPRATVLTRPSVISGGLGINQAGSPQAIGEYLVAEILGPLG